MPNRLFVDELVSVGLVPDGDNPEAEVVIYKNRPVKEPGSNMTTKKTTAGSGPTTREVNMDLSAIEDQDLRKSVEDKIAELESTISELTPEEEPVVKAESDQVQELITKQQEEIADLRKDLDEERADRRTKEYVVKAEEFQGLLGSADESGPVLAAIADKAPEAYEQLEGWLTAASQRKDMAKLFSTLGTGEGEGESDPIAKQDAWVKANKQDGESDIQARSRFWTENPDAVEESRL